MNFEPTEIIDEGDSFSIRWMDGAENHFTPRELRLACACAGCVNEWTGERMLKSESVAEDVKIEDISIVGRYALNFKFSDSHNTGIYSFKYLRELADRKVSSEQ